MKKVGIVLAAIVVVVISGALARSHLAHVPFVGTPAPTKKWEFRVMPSMVQDCGKPGDLLYKITPHKCDPTMPDVLPEHSPAIAADGTIYAGGNKGVVAINSDGTLKWSRENPQVKYEPVLYTFMDDKGQIWFDYNNGFTAGVNRVDANGEGNWVASAVHRVTKTGLLSDGTIFVLWDATGPAFFDPDGTQQRNSGFLPNGDVRQKWWDMEFGVPRECGAAAVGTNDLRFLGCPDGLLVLKADGSTQWRFSTTKSAFQPAIANDGTVYFGSGKDLYALNSDGQLKWKFSAGAEVRSTPAIAKNGAVFFGSSDHYLYAVGADGKLKWKFETEGQVFSPTIGADGTIYALSMDGKLYAIQDLEPNGGLWGQWPKWAGDLHNSWRPAANSE